MSTNDLNLTLVGWVATEPKLYAGPSSTPFTSFRMASTRRYFDRVQNAWVDGRTEWFTVKCWRQQAVNAAHSLRKSDPVLVHGRLATEEWTGTEGARMGLVLEAIAVGPDLTFGSSRFARTVNLSATTSAPDGGSASGQPDLPGGGNGPGGSSDPDGPGYPATDDPWRSAGGSAAERDDADEPSEDDVDEGAGEGAEDDVASRAPVAAAR